MSTRKKSIFYIIAAVILCALSLLLLKTAASLTGFSDWYYKHIYVHLQSLISRFYNIFPFSVAEILLYLLILAVIIKILILICRLFSRKYTKKEKGSFFISFLSGLFFMVSVILFLYSACCGTNYYNTSFAKMYGFSLDQYSEEDLYDTCLLLADELKEEESLIKRDHDGLMKLSGAEQTEASTVMASLGELYPQLSGYYPQAKSLLIPWILSVQSTSGVYSPFTIEANYNNAMTAYNIPFTMCHELSHLKGYMQEEEANFIAFIACYESNIPEFKYSGLMLAYIYVSNELYKYDKEAWKEVHTLLSEGVKSDFSANNAFWKQYEEGKASEIHSSVNDSYLKANGQKAGVKSYDLVTGLIVDYLTGK